MFLRHLLLAMVLSLPIVPLASPWAASARIPEERCNYYLGESEFGLPMSLDLNSIVTWDGQGKEFIYCFGQAETYEEIYAEAYCDDLAWVTFLPKPTRHAPQSEADRQMLTIVCAAPYYHFFQADDGRIVVVDEPPVIVRTAPHIAADELCTIDRFTAIGVFSYPVNPNWKRTDACGEWLWGYVDVDDIRYSLPIP